MTKIDPEEAIGPTSPLPWRAEDNGKGCIRILDRDGCQVGIDAFPLRPGCEEWRVRNSVALILVVLNEFYANEMAKE